MNKLVIRQVPAKQGAAWIGSGYNLFAQSWGQWILIFLVMAVFYLATAILPTVKIGAFPLSLAQLASGFLGPVFLGGLYLAAREQERSGKPQLADLFRGFSGHPELLVWGGIGVILSFLSSLTAFAVAGPAPALDLNDPAAFEQSLLYLQQSLLVNLIFALVTGLAYWFGIPASALDKVPALRAWGLSYRASAYNLGALLVYGLLGALIFLAGLLALGLGLLVALPIGLLANYRAYSEVVGYKL